MLARKFNTAAATAVARSTLSATHSAASTVVACMQDFIVVRSNHPLMRYNRTVADQTIAFLRNGRFER